MTVVRAPCSVFFNYNKTGHWFAFGNYGGINRNYVKKYFLNFQANYFTNECVA